MDYSNVIASAHAAGMAAGNAINPIPMHVIQSDKQIFVVPDGPCGFSWVKIKGNTAFGKWAKKAGIARASYPNGLQISCHDFNQSMVRKEEYSFAYAYVLRGAGIDCHVESRMD
jgi:hypothetical protein